MPNLSRRRQDAALTALGKAVERLRKQREMSQEELAHRAGIDRSYMGRVERGDNNPTLIKLIEIASALDITVTELMAEAEL